MPDENLKTVSKPDPDNWELFQSFFLEEQPSVLSPSSSLDNWGLLESIFGLDNDRPSESTDLKPSNSGSSSSSARDTTSGSTTPSNPISTPEGSTSESKNLSNPESTRNNPTQSTNTNPATSISNSAGRDASGTTHSSGSTSNPTDNPTSGTTHSSGSTSNSRDNPSAGSTKPNPAESTHPPGSTSQPAGNHSAESTNTSPAKTVPNPAEGNHSGATDRNPSGSTVNPTVQAPESIQRAVETAQIAAQIATEAARHAQQVAEAAKKQAEIAQAKAETALEKTGLSIETNSPSHKTHREVWVDFLAQHKFKFIAGAIALIPLLLLLQKIVGSRLSLPTESIYVNPITGKDTNNGTLAAPFQTLPHAIRQAKTGSTIYLAQGDYKIDQLLAIPANTTIVLQAFKDIDGHWAAPFIRALANRKLIAGYPDGSFQPDANLTRAEYATLLAKVFNLPDTPSETKFVDVNSDFWAYPAIQTTYSNNFLKGFPENTFQPDDKVQRVQVVAALVSGLGLTPINSKNTLSIYQDSNLIPPWASVQVATATPEKLIVNYPNLQQLNPTQNATRAETAVMMYQALVKQGKMPAIESPYVVQP